MYYNLQSKVFSIMPTIFMAGFAVISSAIVLFLPETLNIKLPDTIEESIDLDGHKKIQT